MKNDVIYLFYVLIFNTQNTLGLWDKDTNCPHICTCRLEHLTDTAIYRFMQKEKESQLPGELNSVETNDVFYEENLETELLEDSKIVKSATCILQTETKPTELLEKLPKDIETLTLIQGYASGNKSIKFTNLNDFEKLISLEILGPNENLQTYNHSHLICEIDQSLPNLKYLNLERVLIKNSISQIQKFVQEIRKEEFTFEYVVKLDESTHPLTIIQEGADEEVVPYKKSMHAQMLNENPLFIGFNSLFFLRITNCDVNNIHWEMFDGLHNLEYLILEKNHLKFIPSFAFYGTPSLKALSLAHNNLLDMQLTDLAGLLVLEYLDLTYNNFSHLSEISLPPFPNLKLADFGNNPISVIYPNTFEVMNTTDSIIIGSHDMPLTLTMNCFTGLHLLKKLTLNNLKLNVLQKDLLNGMPSLNYLILNGDIREIEFDAFVGVSGIEKLVLNQCKLSVLSMDSFYGLERLLYLDLSKNELEELPPSIFDPLKSIKELYLNGNKFSSVPRDIFSHIHPKLIRLNDNPWHCSCDMAEWKPMIINKIKQKVFKPCAQNTNDKGINCKLETKFMYKYVYDNRVAPKCKEPVQFENWSAFLAMRKLLKCADYKPKVLQRILQNRSKEASKEVVGSVERNVIETKSSADKPMSSEQKRKIKMNLLRKKLEKSKLIEPKVKKYEEVITVYKSNENSNSNELNNQKNQTHPKSHFKYKFYRKQRKLRNKSTTHKPNNNLSNII